MSDQVEEHSVLETCGACEGYGRDRDGCFCEVCNGHGNLFVLEEPTSPSPPPREEADSEAVAWKPAWSVVEEAAKDSSLYNSTVQSALNELKQILVHPPIEPFFGGVYFFSVHAFKLTGQQRHGFHPACRCDHSQPDRVLWVGG